MQSFGATFKLISHFFLLNEINQTVLWRFQRKRLGHVLACCLIKMLSNSQQLRKTQIESASHAP